MEPQERRERRKDLKPSAQMLSYAFSAKKTHCFGQGGQGSFYRARLAIHLPNCSAVTLSVFTLTGPFL